MPITTIGGARFQMAFEATMDDNWRMALCDCAAAQGADPRYKFGRIIGLGEIVVGSRFKPLDPVFGPTQRAQDKDRRQDR